MSLLMGYGKTKEAQNGGTYISAFFTDEFLKLKPEFKGLLLMARHIPPENRKSDKSPHWAFELFCPSEQPAASKEPVIPKETAKTPQTGAQNESNGDEEIPFDQPPA